MFSYVNPGISLESILSKVTVFDILSTYIGVHELPICINNPCRKDENPSLGLYYSSKYNTVSYKDFATGETGNLFGLLMNMWHCSFDEVLAKIDSDIKSMSPKELQIQRKGKSLVRRVNSDLQVKIRDWKDYDYEFWNKYGINHKWLEFGDVFPIDYIIIKRENNTQYIKAEKYAYVYVERKDGIVTLKIYQPYSERMKWLSKHDGSVIDLWTKIPKEGDKLIITSSRKDALCTWANTGIPCVSFQGEGYWPKEHVIQQLKDRFKHVYVLFDNDFKSEVNHGQLFAQKLCDYFNLENLTLPTELGEKDQSDIVKHYGPKVLKNVIMTLLKQSKNS